MRLLEIISGLGTGGAERALASRLKSAPDDVETHVLSTKTHLSALASEVSRYAHLHTETSKLTRVIQEVQPDVLVTHNPREALRVLVDPRLYRKYPVAVVAHNAISSEYITKAALLDRALPRVNARASIHIAVSSSAAQGIQCRNARRISTILLGGVCSPDAKPLHDLWPPKTKRRALVLGRLSPQKNIDGLLMAIERQHENLRRSGTHVAIVGTGDMAAQLHSMVDRLNINDLVTFRGWVEPADGALAAAHTLFIASTNEGGPLTLYEALLAGLQVVSTPTGAAPDLANLGYEPHVHVLAGASIADLENGLQITSSLPPQSPTDRRHQAERFSFLECHRSAHAIYKLFRTLV